MKTSRKHFGILILLILLSGNLVAQNTATTDLPKKQERKPSFTLIPISEADFRLAQKKNYNADFTKDVDSTKLEPAFEAIAKTYNNDEKELANRELCNSPRCLTSLHAYYPTLDIYSFFILDYHYQKVCFVSSKTYQMSSKDRFRGSYGVMSKDGLWVGLERQDCDTFLQLEICQITKSWAASIISFDFKGIDISEKEQQVMFWAAKNLIYMAIYDYKSRTDLYYAIKFSY